MDSISNYGQLLSRPWMLCHRLSIRLPAQPFWSLVNVQARWTDIHRASKSTGPRNRKVCLPCGYKKTATKQPSKMLSSPSASFYTHAP